MEAINFKFINKICYYSISLLIGLVALASCNKEIKEKITFVEPESEDVNFGKKSYRVAYIVLEGAVGSVVGSEATDFNSMPFLASMTEKGLFTWNSIASDYTSDVSYYADLLTGVNKEKHKVASNDLVGAQLNKYPLIFDRIKHEVKARTAVISSNTDLQDLSKNSTVDNKQFFQTDAEVVQEAKKELAKDDAYFSLITLSNVDKVGKQSGYGPKNSNYINALKEADSQIKELVTSIEARKNYSTERWLIVVTSNRGGDYEIDPALNDNSLYSVPARNNFVLFYNNQFKYKIIQKVDLSDPTYDGAAIRYNGSATSAALDASRASIYNLGNTAANQFTIQLKIKVHTIGTNNPTFLSKMGNTGNSDDGWSFIYSGATGWRLKVKGTQITDSQPFRLNEWYTLTAKIYNDNGTRKAKVFRNGVLAAEGTIGTVQGSSTEALKLGYGTAWGSGAAHSITDLRIYNTALPDAYIGSNYCSTAVYSSDTYWDNLIGYWPAIDGTGNVITDKSKNKRDFTISGPAVWNSFSERSGSLCPTAPETLDMSTIRSIDAPLLIYNWLGVLGTDKFNLDAQVWSPNYSNN